MVDIHCHILPDFDDGAADLEDALAMARIAAASGITDIIATPHFPGEESALRRLETLIGRYWELEAAMKAAQIPVNLHPGGEILCLPPTPRLAREQKLPTLGDTDYLLCEFPFNESALYMNEMLRTLSSYGYRIVVAHPERYEAVQRSPGMAEDWFRQGYALQMNKGSILGSFGPRAQTAAGRLLDQGLYHLVASDAHSPEHRTPNMRRLRRHLADRCPGEYIRILLEENPMRLLRNQDMAPAE